MVFAALLFLTDVHLKCETGQYFIPMFPSLSLSLSVSPYASQGASALFDMIEYYESATHLNISFNKHIGTRGWQAAAHMMRKVRGCPHLQRINTEKEYECFVLLKQIEWEHYLLHSFKDI